MNRLTYLASFSEYKWVPLKVGHMNLKKGQTRVSDPSRSLTPIALQIPSDTYGDPYPNYLYLFYCYFFVPSEYDCNPIFPRVINYAILHIPPNSQNMEKKRKIMTTLFMCFFFTTKHLFRLGKYYLWVWPLFVFSTLLFVRISDISWERDKYLLLRQQS